MGTVSRINQEDLETSQNEDSDTDTKQTIQERFKGE